MQSSKFSHVQPMYPALHRRKVPFAPQITVPSGLTIKLAEIRRLDRELGRHILRLEDYRQLVTDAWSKNIHRSVQVEGNPLSLETVREITRNSLGGETGPEPKLTEPVQEIWNHILVHLLPELWRPPWTTRRLTTLHAVLLKGAPESKGPGKFRDRPGPSSVVSSTGQELLRTAPSEAIGEELDSLLHWRNTLAEAYDPVVAATVFFHEFESIHPFVDGNGRAGRVLFQIYLQLSGLPNSNLCLIDYELMKDIEAYYRMLSWADQTASYTDLIDYFADAVLESYRNAHARYKAKDLLSSDMDETTKRLMIAAKDHGEWFSIQQASEWAPSLSEQTIGKHLRILVKDDVLESKGSTRSKRFRFMNLISRWQREAEGWTRDASTLTESARTEHSPPPPRSTQEAHPEK
jgi:Fic family protein